MFISVTADEVKSAPPYVRQWIADLMSGESPTPDLPETSSEEVAKPPVVPEMKDVLAKAAAFIKANGEDALQGVLEKLEIKRVKECPEDKLAALLAEVAVS